MKKEEGRRKKEEGRRKKEEGRRKKEEARRKKEEARRKKEEGKEDVTTYALKPSMAAVFCTWITSFACQQSVLSPTQNDCMELVPGSSQP